MKNKFLIKMHEIISIIFKKKRFKWYINNTRISESTLLSYERKTTFMRRVNIAKDTSVDNCLISSMNFKRI